MTVGRKVGAFVLLSVLPSFRPSVAFQDPWPVLDRASAAFDTVRTLQADFVQVIDNPMLGDPDTMVAVATFAKVEEEVAAVPGAEVVTPTAAEPELSVERGKKEEEVAEKEKKK